jgi:hypothetical protein
MVTYRRVEWAINTFLSHKSPGMDGIFPALLQQGRRIVIPYLVKIFRACLAMGYVPAICRQVKVVFIPKPWKNLYTGPRDFRPISLTSFLFKTLERLVDRYIRDGVLAVKPLHPNQHAYQAGKSVETAFRQLVVRVEKVLDQRKLSLGVFLNIKEPIAILPLTPCVLHSAAVGSNPLLSGGLGLTWTAACLWRLSMMFV